MGPFALALDTKNSFATSSSATGIFTFHIFLLFLIFLWVVVYGSNNFSVLLFVVWTKIFGHNLSHFTV